jgi:hypothetical protein
MHLSFNIEKGALGDWAHRIGRTMALVMFGIVPVHFFVPCSASERTMEIATGLGLFVTLLSIIARRFGPFGLALGAFVLHALCTH